MTRIHQLKSLLSLASVLSGALAAASCGETTTNPLTQLTFDRPVDIAFACFGGLRFTGDGTVEQSAMPTSACETRSLPKAAAADPPIVPAGQEGITDVKWYGVVLESGPGTVDIIEFTAQPASPAGTFEGFVSDSDPLTPGMNGISVGEEPVAIATDPAGCHMVTANAGSCDLSVLDLNSALRRTGGGSAQVTRLAVTNMSGAVIDARPAAMVGEPSAQEIGNRCAATPTGLVYVAYPSCHLVAGIDTATGKIVTGIQYDATGVPTIVGGDITCPSECGGGAGGGAMTPGVRPVALDLEVDSRTATRRLVIGSDNSPSIAIVELDDASRPVSVSQVALENTGGTLGVTALALSPEIGMGGGSTGPFDFIADETVDQFQFVYAVATDGTVRVAEILDVRRECDTQVDPRYARGVTAVRSLSCFPVGDPATPPRRAGARGPGIRLPGTAIPLSVEFSRVDHIPEGLQITDPRTGDLPSTLVGYFAAVTTSNGATYLVNVDDDDYPDVSSSGAPLAVPVSLAMAHQLRDALGSRSITIDDEDVVFDPMPGAEQTDHSEDDKGCDYAGKFSGTVAIGGPRITAPPERKVPTGSIAQDKITQLPYFKQILCDRRARHGTKAAATDLRAISEMLYAAPPADRDRTFPDLMALPAAETWTLLWEGSLSLNAGDTDIDGPGVRESAMTVDSFGLHILDDSEPFCEAGVEPFDIVQMRGCDPSVGGVDCPIGHTCFVHPESKIQGLGSCLPAADANRLANACKDFLTSTRRYTVKTSDSGELVAMARRVELRTTPVDGCTDDAQCEALGDYAVRFPNAADPSEDTTAPDPHTWACVTDPLRAPKLGTGKRCELKCDTTADCLTGTVCQGAVAGQAKSGFCMEGVIPPQVCLNSSQRYELRAGEAFSVIGSASGYVHPIFKDMNGQCRRDPAASHLDVGRIPLAPRDPAAPNTVATCVIPEGDPRMLTGEVSTGVFEPNPCATTVQHTMVRPVYKIPTDPADPNMRCVLSPDNGGVEIVDVQVPAVRFRNRSMTFTMVEPYQGGDAACHGDRMGNRGQIPHVVPGFALQFRQVGGFAPVRLLTDLSTDNAPSFPVRVVRGPVNSLWVIDEGDFLSSSTAASTRGKVFRIEPLAPTLETVFK